MTDDFTPETEPSGSLDPPRRHPPTAVGAMTPEPEPEPGRGARSVHHVLSSHDHPLHALLRPVANAVRDAFREVARVLERL